MASRRQHNTKQDLISRIVTGHVVGGSETFVDDVDKMYPPNVFVRVSQLYLAVLFPNVHHFEII